MWPAAMFRSLSVHRKMVLILGMAMLPVVGLMMLYLTAMRQFAAAEHAVDHLLAVPDHFPRLLHQLIQQLVFLLFSLGEQVILFDGLEDFLRFLAPSRDRL